MASMPPRLPLASLALSLVFIAAMPAAQGRDDLASLLSIAGQPAVSPALVSSSLDAGAVVDDLTWKALDGSDVTAYLVRPEKASAECCAGVLFVHWFAPPDPTSNRTQFLDEAKALARRGVISLLPSTFWSEAARYRGRTWQTDFANSVAQARELRRAFAMLGRQPHVERSRMAIVGHDYGAMFGSMVAAVEPDAKVAVLIAGVPNLGSWYEFGSSTGVPTGGDLVKFRADLARIAPGHAVSLFTGPTLFQFGTKDKYTPKDQYEAFFAASASPAKEMKIYDAGHEMTLPLIRDDRTAWLTKQLRVK
jgi:dienelactone hydrolase